MIFCRESRTRAVAARILRRMSASSGEAASAISSSPVMEVVIFSSRKRFGMRESNSRLRQPLSPRPEA